MYLTKTPGIVRQLFNDLIWDISTERNVIYLTFDDGPAPDITDWTLQQLERYDAKATFFCIGQNVIQYPDISQRILEAEHRIGNHTHTHINGWECDTASYSKNVEQCAESISSDLFRPPFGKATRQQIGQLKPKYSIIMWDVLSGDFDRKITPAKCLQNVISNVKKGSIIVFHDSVKAWPNLEYALPKTLEHFTERGFRFEAIPQLGLR